MAPQQRRAHIGLAGGPRASCSLCGTTDVRLIVCADGRHYVDCKRCALIALARGQLPSRELEFETYLHHQNDPADPRYRAFLARLLDPLKRHLRPGMKGLDYGSGPGPAIAPMLEAAGVPMTNYDPFFAPDPRSLERTYDVITCSETVEHFHEPARDFTRLDRLLRKGGWLGIMTRMPGPEEDFDGWWYRRDPTHVAFYRDATMRWIAQHFGWMVSFPAQTVTLFQKPRGSSDPPSLHASR